MPPLLDISDLSTEIRHRGAIVRALDGVSLSVEAGECLGLVGESGSGKTMTALSVLGLLPPGGAITGGRVVLDGTDLVPLGRRDLERVRGRSVGMIFQDPTSALNPVMTIGAQVAEPVRVHQGLSRRAAAERAIEVLSLARLPEPGRVAAAYPHELSGGMRQRAMIAMALACEPSLLIADEPTTALDVTIQREILDLLDELRQRLSMAVVLVTHDLGVIGAHTDRTAVMYGGRIVESAATAALFAGPRHPYTEALFEALPEMARAGGRTLYSIPGRPPDLTGPSAGCRFAPRCRHGRDYCRASEPALDGDHPAHLYACFFPVGSVIPASPAGPPVSAWSSGGAAPGPARAPVPAPAARPRDGAAGPLLAVRELAKAFGVTSGAVLPRKAGEVSAVAGVSFEIAAGQTFGLVGESGCGKTTLARLLVGLEQADSGSISFRGTELTGLSRRQLRPSRPSIQLMFQDPFGSLDPRMRVGSILREPLIIQKTGRKRSHWRTVARLLEEVGLPADAARQFPREFSGGQRQRLALARALILQPDLIVADEPVSALDVSVQAQILNLMRKLQRQYGLSYLFISHDLSVVRYMADVIGVMYLGKLVEVGAAETVCTRPAHPYTRGLIDAVPVVALSDGGGPPGRALAGEPPARAGTAGTAGNEAGGGGAGPGCRFAGRCPRAQETCRTQEPPLRPAAGGQLAACHFPLDAPDTPARGRDLRWPPGQPADARIGIEPA